MLTKLLLVNGAKIGIIGSIGALLVAEAGTFGIPAGWPLISLLVNVFLLGWHLHAAGSSLVGGMVEPDENSSNVYVHFFRSSHLFFHRPTTYFTHKSMWKLFTKDSKED